MDRREITHDENTKWPWTELIEVGGYKWHWVQDKQQRAALNELQRQRRLQGEDARVAALHRWRQQMLDRAASSWSGAWGPGSISNIMGRIRRRYAAASSTTPGTMAPAAALVADLKEKGMRSQVAAIRKLPAYALHAQAVLAGIIPALDEPDPEDLQVSKRDWGHRVQIWRRLVEAGAMGSTR